MNIDPKLSRLHYSGPRILQRIKRRKNLQTNMLNELIYERMFSNTINSMNIENQFYPIKSAATYSLLYLILRIIKEQPVHNVLELGAGQSTILLDKLASYSGISVSTLESDEIWATEIQRLVKHNIGLSPLINKNIRNKSVLTYDINKVDRTKKVDCLIIDGPIGKVSHSRWGCLEFIDQVLAEEFVLIFDDADREGELKTISETLSLLSNKGIEVQVGITKSRKHQCILATKKYAATCYF